MAYAFTDPKVGMQPIAATSTVQNHPIGTCVRAFDPTYGEAEFIYLKGAASTAVGELVIYDTYANTTKRAVAGDRGPCAWAMSANVANQYGWYQVKGAVAGKVAAAFAAGGNVYLTATAGTIANAAVIGDKVDGARGKTAIDTPSTGLAVLQIDRPSLNGNG